MKKGLSMEYLLKKNQELERKLAEDKKMIEAFDNMIKKNPDGIIVVDREGIVHTANPAAESIFDRKADELLGETFEFPMLAGETTELNIVHRGEEMVTVEMRVTESMLQGETAYLASLRDVTERKRMEAQLSYPKRWWRLSLWQVVLPMNSILP